MPIADDEPGRAKRIRRVPGIVRSATVPRAVGWPNSHVLDWMRTRLETAGLDPSAVAPEPFAYWRLREVERRVGVARSTLYRWIGEGRFPASVRLGGAR
jgi:predicted DNA-binding transcriptional regulator AlpA